MIGIYKIINKLNEDCYVGSSTRLKDRKARHFRDLKNGIHHSVILQRAIDKYKIENFEFEIIEECSKDELLVKEQYYMDLLNPKYNVCKIAGSSAGCIQPEEANKKRKQ